MAEITETDEILVQRTLNGDLNSFETLVTRYQKSIFSLIYRMTMSKEDSTDLVQEVFLQAFRSLGNYRGEARFRNWLYRIASNKCLDFLRRNKKLRTVELTEQFDIDEKMSKPTGYIGTNPEAIYIYEEKIRRLRQLIAGLPDRYKLILILFHYENMSYQLIAETLDIPVKTVATRLYRAKILLKEKLGGEIDEVQ